MPSFLHSQHAFAARKSNTEAEIARSLCTVSILWTNGESICLLREALAMFRGVAFCHPQSNMLPPSKAMPCDWENEENAKIYKAQTLGP